MKKHLLFTVLALCASMTPACSGENTQGQEPPAGESNILVVYFSLSGNTQRVASRIIELTGADSIKLKTSISYYGGQQNILKDIIPLIPPHELYNEPFAGGAALLFANEPVEINVINDLNGEIVNFYRTATLNFRQLKHSRDQMNFAKFVYNNPYRFTNVQRAWAVWAMSKLCFSSDFTGSFSLCSKGKKPNLPESCWGEDKLYRRYQEPS